MKDWKSQDEGGIDNIPLGETDKLIKSFQLLKQMEVIDSNIALQRVKSNIGNRKSKGLMMVLQRIAAILLLPLLSFIIWQGVQITNYKQNVSEHKISTPPTLRSNFVLPDGTKIWMNGGTSLQYPEQFVGEERMVVLNGEAYFEVAKDKQHPFIVKMGDLLVEATGTEFNISSFFDDSKQEILLTEGSVKLHLQKDCQRVQLTDLKLNELAIFDRNNRKMSVNVVDTEKYIAWKEGRIIFKNDNLEDVITKLERWYNIDFKYSDEIKGSYAFTGTFEGEDLARILNCIELTTPIHFEILPPAKDKNNLYHKTSIKITPMSR